MLMNIIKRHTRGVLSVLLLCFLFFCPPAVAFGSGTFENPDFAFPADVRQDAEKVFDKAMRSSDPSLALKAAMQLYVADRLVSSDSIAVSVERYQKIASKFGAPWNALAEILTGKAYATLYVSHRGTFDRRVLPLDELNEDPKLWSGLQFRDQVMKCCERALKNESSLSSAPIKDISSVLTSTQQAEEFGLSVFDFVSYQAIGLLGMIENSSSSGNPIPFVCKDAVRPSDNNVSSDISVETIIERLIEADFKRASCSDALRDGAGALMLARLAKVKLLSSRSQKNSNELITGYAREVLDMYPEDSGLRPFVVINLYLLGKFNYSDNSLSREFYDLLISTIDRTESASEKKILVNMADQLLVPSYSLSTPSQWLPGKEGKISLTASNISDGYLLLVPVENSLAESQKLTNSTLRASSEPTVLRHIIHTQTGPSVYTDTISVNPLQSGYYALVMSKTSDLGGLYPELKSNHPDMILVSGLTAFCSDEATVSKNMDPGNKGGQYSVSVDTYLYVSRATDNSPVKGAKVDFTSTYYRGKGEKKTSITDPDGKVALPFENCKALITLGKERLLWDGGKGYASPPPGAVLSASIMTDLALYHPGDSINAVVVLSRCENNIVNVASDRKFKLVLRDANYKEVQTLDLKTDDSGRAVASLQIPAEGLTGRFMLSARDGNDNIGTTFVDVADYKAPSFRVILDKPEITDYEYVSESENGESSSKDRNGERIEISGSVTTYSGAPLADANVTLSFSYRQMWRPWFNYSVPATEYGVEVSTDERGNFMTELLLSNQNLKDYMTGYFTVSATVTSAAGETQSSSPGSFTLGEGYEIVYAGNGDVEITGNEVSLPVVVNDMSGNKIVKNLSYSLTRLDYSGKKEEKVVASGEFQSPSLKLRSGLMPSGVYNLKVILAEGCKTMNNEGDYEWRPDTLSQRLTVFRPDDKLPPVETPLWIPQSVYYASPGESHVEVTFGSGFADEWIFCQTVDRFGTIRREWLRPEGMNMTVKVESPREGEMKRIFLCGTHDLDNTINSIAIYPAEENRKTEFRVETFRDKLVPGSLEKWRFKLLSGWSPEEGKNGKQGMSEVEGASVIAVLSNEALNAITPFRWNFYPRSVIDNNTVGRLRHYIYGETYANYRLSRFVSADYDDARFELPSWLYSGEFYDYGYMVPYGQSSRIMYKSMSNRYMSSRAVTTGAVEAYEMADMAVAEAAPEMETASDKIYVRGTKSVNGSLKLEEEVVVGGGEGAGTESGAESDVNFRSMEMPLAFFKPLLTTDKDGIVDIEFEVPNFNTTWALQLVGYDRKLNSAILRESAVASKPLMVSTVMPRFLRTGDKAQITSSAFNNTDEPLDIDMTIEIFDIVSGRVLESLAHTYKNMGGGASENLTIDFNVPFDLDRVGVRAFAVSNKGKDGEQSMLSILPSSTPVRDAYTFYMEPGCAETELKLPVMKPTDRVTLNFCNNPGWFVLTSLSGLVETDSQSAIDQSVALYSQCVATGLLNNNPELREGLLKMLESHSPDLVSPLEQNQNLKAVQLNYTPWVNNAESETARMANLRSLTETESAKKSIAICIERLSKLYNSDGSFSWMPGMPGSEWMTRQVMSCLGDLRKTGNLPDDKKLRSMLKGAVNFTDSSVAKNYMEITRKNKGKFPLGSEISYLFDRSNATDAKPSGTILEMQEDMMTRLPKEWRELTLMQKSTAAILLNRAGGKANEDLAREILESVRQFASYKADKGLWFDNINEGYFSPTPLLLTSRCLAAYREVLPESDAITGFEQYLILSRQTTDWNLSLGEASVASVVNSVLGDNGSGKKVTSDRGPSTVEIYLNGKPLKVPSDEGTLSGNFYMDLSAEDASGATLSIHRHGDVPAWGGVLCQYVSPIKDVKENSVPQLKIEKALLPVSTGVSGKKAGSATTKFSKGERIRVTLTLTTDRNLDYLFISDNLGAWMQPVEQLTRYTNQDNLWYLRETRNSAVNFYIMSVPKGKYVLSYEVNADRDGEYSTGIADAQCLYYPMIASHSGGMVVKVE